MYALVGRNAVAAIWGSSRMVDTGTWELKSKGNLNHAAFGFFTWSTESPNPVAYSPLLRDETAWE